MCILLLEIFTFCTTSADPARPLSTHRMQNISMKNALASKPNVQKRFWEFALAPHANHSDCCSWRMVGCTDGTVTSLILLPYRMHRYTVSIGWLPSTMQSIHSAGGHVRDFSLHTLPKQLRYIFLRDASVFHGTSRDIWRTSDLPPHLEEAHLRISLHIALRFVIIDHLPSKLRLLDISNANGIDRVLVDDANISETLERFRVISPAKKKRTIVEYVNGRRPDWRILSTRIGSSESEIMKDFRFYPEYQTKMAMMWTDG